MLARNLAHQTFAVFGPEAVDRFRAHGWPVSSTPNLLRNVGPRPSFAQHATATDRARPVLPSAPATDRARPVPPQRFGVLARDLAHQTFAVFGHKALDRFRTHGWPVSSTPNLLRNVGPRPSFAQHAPATDRARPVPSQWFGVLARVSQTSRIDSNLIQSGDVLIE